MTDDDESGVTGWSSLIGIITAICGNILISFALNTQRYAHMRLNGDRIRGADGDGSQRKSHNRKSNASRTYGTEYDGTAEERSRKNANSPPDEDIEAGLENGEADRQALIPKIGSRKSSSTSNDSYVDDEKDDDEKSGKSYLKSPIWWLGISLMVVGEAGNFLAYGFAPASIVSPLGVVALVSNCLIAPLLLHEQFRVRDGLGVIIAIGGCVTVVLSASGSNPKLDPDDIWHLITQWEFETYLGVTAFLIIVLMVASNKYGDRTVLIDLGLVGLFGGYTALSTKGVASLLSNTIWRVFTFPITYLLVVILVATAVLQIKYVNRALQHFNSTIVIPTQFVLFTISVIVGSAVLYRDFERRSAEDAGKFIGGCALTFLGVWCITSGRSDGNGQDDEVDENDDDGVEPVHLVDHESDRRTRNADVDKRQLDAPHILQRSRTTDELPPQVLITTDHDSPDQAIQSRLQATPAPAVRSAIHPASSAEIPSNTADSSKPPTLHATTSEPLVNTINTPDAALRPFLEGQRSSPHILAQSSDPSQVQGTHRLLGRHSITDLLPGPLMSPLSSSLSAIVADSLRRGVDHTPMSSLRSKSFRRRKTGESSRGVVDVAGRGRSIDSANMDRGFGDELTEHFDDDDDAEPARPSKHRGRSFSATISDIFTTSPKKRKTGDDGSAR